MIEYNYLGPLIGSPPTLSQSEVMPSDPTKTSITSGEGATKVR